MYQDLAARGKENRRTRTVTRRVSEPEICAILEHISPSAAPNPHVAHRVGALLRFAGGIAPTRPGRSDRGRSTRIAADLRRLRARLRLSQEAIAERAGIPGIHRTYVGSVERAERNVSVDNICRLAQAGTGSRGRAV